MERLCARLLDDFTKGAKIIGDWIMERKLGEVVEVDGVALRVVEASDTFSCDGCYFLNSEQDV